MPAPDWIGRYRIELELGRGGMGVVYEGYDDQLQRRVAIKTIAAVEADENQRKRFVREARAAARVRHPNRPEWSSDGEHLYFTLTEFEADVWVLELEESRVN